MENYFSMTRHGMINLKGQQPSNVQCSGVGHPLYKYAVAILYANETTLDKNGWLIDNNEIDTAVQKTVPDSCERMLVQIQMNVTESLMKANIPILGFKILLRPTYVANEKVADFCLNIVINNDFRSAILELAVEIV